MNDNWKNRSTSMRCATCMWYVPKGEAQEAVKGKKPAQLGRCRRHGPTMGGFPAVFSTDWCGDHKLDEEKLED